MKKKKRTDEKRGVECEWAHDPRKTVILFHGSIRLFKNDILFRGIQEAEGIAAFDGVFLTKTFESALLWAKMKERRGYWNFDTCGAMPSDPESLIPVIFVIGLPIEETDHLTPDFNNYDDLRFLTNMKENATAWDDPRFNSIIYNRCKGRPVGSKDRSPLRGKVRLSNWESWKNLSPGLPFNDCGDTTIPPEWIVDIIDF